MPDCDNNSKRGVHLFCGVLFLILGAGLGDAVPAWVTIILLVLAVFNLLFAIPTGEL